MSFGKRKWAALALGTLALPLVAAAPTEGEMSWTDEQGTAFVFLAGRMTYADAQSACNERGMDVFNYEYLTPAEQKRFLESEAVKKLIWREEFHGLASERRVADVWGSSLYHGERSVLGVYQYGTGKSFETKVQWDYPTSAAHNAICMFGDHSLWECTSTIVCRWGGSASYYWATEYSADPADAMVRLHNRFDRSPHDGTCAVDGDVPNCKLIR